MRNEFSFRQGTARETAPLSDSEFASPDNSYAPLMFWFWNDGDNIKHPEHYAAMAKELSDKGLNPGFVHARLFRPQVPFWLSDDWYRCFKAALEMAKQCGTHLSYCMGDPGFPDKYLLADHPDHPHFPVGGLELHDHPELRAASLDCQVVTADSNGCCEVPEAFFAVAVQVDGDGRLLSSTLQIVAENGEKFIWKAPTPGKWSVYAFRKVYDLPSQFKNSFLDRRLAKPWLELENSKYETLFGKEFGSVMPGVFFDWEGFFGYKLAWSDDLADTYRKMTGADIRERLPLLLGEDAEGLWMKARCDWFSAVATIYGECIFDPFDHWCRSRGMYAGCHFWEEELFLQSTRMADFMGIQRRISMPGVDALFATIHDPRHFKESQSVCEFEGRQLMCETFSIGGWHLTPAELKRSANSAIAMGITQLLPHGANSSRNPLNVSYPPDFFDWNPYWRYFRQYSDFFRRAAFVNDHGRLDADVLLFCPLDSVNAMVGDAYFDMSTTGKDFWSGLDEMPLRHKNDIHKIETAYTAAIRKLYDARIDYCVADRHYLGEMQVENGGLALGEFRFHTLILPPLKIIDLVTAEKLLSFAASGGTVYALGELPKASIEHGGGDPELAERMRKLTESPNFAAASGGIDSVLPQLRPCVEFESGAFPLIATQRKVGSRNFFWLANNEDSAHRFTLRIRNVSGAAAVWNCETGAKQEIPVEFRASGVVRVELELAAAEGIWLVFDPDRSPAAVPAAPNPERRVELPGGWKVRIDPEEQPPSDFPPFPVPGRFLDGFTVSRLESWLDWDLEKFSGFVDYETTVEPASVSGRERLDLGEVRHTAEVWVNGVRIGARMWPPFAFEIGKWLRPGKNGIKVRIGNLILNAVTRYPDYKWKWHQPPTREQLDCGLFGPVQMVCPE